MVYSITNKIQKAADQLVFSSGVRGWNMDDCAEEAGITKKTLYRYVSSKEKLVEDVLLRFIRETQVTLSKSLESEADFISGINTILSLLPQMLLRINSNVIQSIFKAYPDVKSVVIRERV
ncbi:MAG: TetR/AcrR family transcriptional regulator, partial [Spirochaetales bacterium]|nr:TetR/AcrR family transcriptional regulator [Spirochaetales bacterium]